MLLKVLLQRKLGEEYIYEYTAKSGLKTEYNLVSCSMFSAVDMTSEKLKVLVYLQKYCLKFSGPKTQVINCMLFYSTDGITLKFVNSIVYFCD